MGNDKKYIMEKIENGNKTESRDIEKGQKRPKYLYHTTVHKMEGTREEQGPGEKNRGRGKGLLGMPPYLAVLIAHYPSIPGYWYALLP